MKANEAPEKIYIHVKGDKVTNTWNSTWIGVHDVEYTRTDAFIEKACEWFKSHGSFTIGFDGATVRDFLNFINK